jgi:hypothetical protein
VGSFVNADDTEEHTSGLVDAGGPGKGALLSKDKRYRYLLTRRLDYRRKGTVVFVMLNPSTADHITDDQTIKAVKHFGVANGFSHLKVVNLMALRTAYPKELRLADDPYGPHNEDIVEQTLAGADRVVVAWGAHDLAPFPRVFDLFPVIIGAEPWCLGLTKYGHPRHPCRIDYDTPLERWNP